MSLRKAFYIIKWNVVVFVHDDVLYVRRYAPILVVNVCSADFLRQRLRYGDFRI